ncbi:Cutinase transcription factor 1 beta [Metarhizium album ARSEF 1941]|uniref:Cutinase transcription factor 1 beta n=1 Tax=Metarhizium album (strain ARSEF 1941) TaxID=1081103 RepID=A0A0B2WIB7_METAS|nr:Cutinase transcription factor 1 beta [Metarhizium album ARSEF 1941]KHN95756.1 Cutinase transcription factor 1 beta [Metarhizium album ARSEF 1941]
MASEPIKDGASPASSQSDSGDKSNGKKRATGDDSNSPHKVTKRRAARACASCRARKVRCDVVEGAPCGNCRWDNVECIVQESRRRKKNSVAAPSAVGPASSGSAEAQLRAKATAASASMQPTSAMATPPLSLTNPDFAPRAGSVTAFPSHSPDGAAPLLPKNGLDGHVPHMLYQRSGYRQASVVSQTSSCYGSGRTAQFLNSLELPDAGSQLPAFVRPLPAKIAPEDVQYLALKGALTLPSLALQSALLQGYIEYVYPYMPLIDLHHFLSIVDRRDGVNGQTSLLLYQSIMFSATAFVDMKYLRDAGFSSRKAARKAFFQKTRLLYDFDYEQDRLVLVQSLMQMTYWYETPDDQKDTWHWMGVAISLAHTIGLHRNPGSTSMSTSKQRLWKRIWWSCFMRDRLIALGMRRPTRIKDEDFDVPMLVESDFDIQVLAEGISVVPPECTLVRDVGMQRELAAMCISKARLCLCISHMLKTQYSVLIRDKMKPENTTNSTMMLFPNKQMDNVDSVNAVDLELGAWAASLPDVCQYRPLSAVDVEEGRSTVAVHRTLLHMVFHTTVSALHRPQFLPSSPTQAPTTSRQVQEMSRLRVRDAAAQITRMATELQRLRLEKFLPTTGVTVILPAMIIHLLEMKAPSSQARDRATRGFRQCMRVMEKLREIYAAADYATGFLDAALRKAAIDVRTAAAAAAAIATTGNSMAGHHQQALSAAKPDLPAEFTSAAAAAQTTPPPDNNLPYMAAPEAVLLTAADLDKVGPAVMPTCMPPPPPATINAAALELSTNSPPQTDFDSAQPTPSASGQSEAQLVDHDTMDLDFMQGHDEFDWNAVAGTEFDVDQWLQFPDAGAGSVSSSSSSSVSAAASAPASAPASASGSRPDGGAEDLPPAAAGLLFDTCSASAERLMEETLDLAALDNDGDVSMGLGLGLGLGLGAAEVARLEAGVV